MRLTAGGVDVAVPQVAHGDREGEGLGHVALVLHFLRVMERLAGLFEGLVEAGEKDERVADVGHAEDLRLDDLHVVAEAQRLALMGERGDDVAA